MASRVGLAASSVRQREVGLGFRAQGSAPEAPEHLLLRHAFRTLAESRSRLAGMLGTDW
jgi:hypothetical protein